MDSRGLFTVGHACVAIGKRDNYNLRIIIQCRCLKCWDPVRSSWKGEMEREFESLLLPRGERVENPTVAQ